MPAARPPLGVYRAFKTRTTGAAVHLQRLADFDGSSACRTNPVPLPAVDRIADGDANHACTLIPRATTPSTTMTCTFARRTCSAGDVRPPLYAKRPGRVVPISNVRHMCASATLTQRPFRSVECSELVTRIRRVATGCAWQCASTSCSKGISWHAMRQCGALAHARDGELADGILFQSHLATHDAVVSGVRPRVRTKDAFDIDQRERTAELHNDSHFRRIASGGAEWKTSPFGASVAEYCEQLRAVEPTAPVLRADAIVNDAPLATAAGRVGRALQNDHLRPERHKLMVALNELTEGICSRLWGTD